MAQLNVPAEEIEETDSVMAEISHRTADCTALVAALKQKVQSKELSTNKGISFLQLKNQLMMKYLLSLGGVVLSKVVGTSIQGRSFIDQLIELRVVLEKIRPIDHKLKYQVDKLIRNASEQKPEADPLLHKANLDNLNDDDSDTDEDVEERTTSKKDVYCPPKVAPQPYDDDEASPAKQVEKVKKKSINRLLIRELQEEFLETPMEIHNKGDGYSGHLTRHVQDKQRYEETYMTRLPETRKDKHTAKAISTMGVLGDEITDFRPKRAPGGQKRKGSKSKKAAGSKKRFRKK